MRNRGVLFVVTLLLFSVPAMAIDIDTGDTVRPNPNFISFDPVTLVLGGLNANYERLFGHCGILVEGNYTFPLLGSKSYDGVLACRYHFVESNTGGFVGPYIKTGGLEGSIANGSGTTYRYNFHYTTAGLSLGYRGWLWQRHHLLYTVRLGGGYPLSTTWSWNIAPPGTINGVSTDFVKTIAEFPGYFDSEAGISFGF